MIAEAADTTIEFAYYEIEFARAGGTVPIIFLDRRLQVSRLAVLNDGLDGREIELYDVDCDLVIHAVISRMDSLDSLSPGISLVLTRPINPFLLIKP